jgi:hypothetical protein
VAGVDVLHGVDSQEPDGVYQPLHQLCRIVRPSTVMDRPPGLQLRADGWHARRKPRPDATVEGCGGGNVSQRPPSPPACVCRWARRRGHRRRAAPFLGHHARGRGQTRSTE